MSDWKKILMAFFICLVFFFSVICGGGSILDETTVMPAQTYEYGLVVDSFSVVKGQVEPGQTLGAILYLHHIDHPKMFLIFVPLVLEKTTRCYVAMILIRWRSALFMRSLLPIM